MIIAIDGPSGSGKSSVSRAVARHFGLRYLDTGSMYRAVTWYMLDRGVDVTDAQAVADAVAGVIVEPGTDPDHPGIRVAGVDVSGPIRGDDVTSSVSAVSAVPRVRELMVAMQRDIAAGAPRGIVVEGRDIAGVVLPDADLKVFLTADPDARAARRAAETDGGVADTKANLVARDSADSARVVSPFTQSDDAMVLDTTHLDLSEVVDHVIELATRSV